jgi:hypothetical protein
LKFQIKNSKFQGGTAGVFDERARFVCCQKQLTKAVDWEISEKKFHVRPSVGK